MCDSRDTVVGNKGSHASLTLHYWKIQNNKSRHHSGSCAALQNHSRQRDMAKKYDLASPRYRNPEILRDLSAEEKENGPSGLSCESLF